MKVTRLRLLPNHTIRLTVWGDGGRAFLALFRGCWRQMPRTARCLILAHWKSGNPAYQPLIELSNMWVDSDTCFAQVTCQRMEVKFSARDFTVLPESVARWIVAHELAHVYQKAIGRLPGGDGEFQNEQEADAIAEGWGFNQGPRIVFGILLNRQKLSLEEAAEELARMGLA